MFHFVGLYCINVLITLYTLNDAKFFPEIYTKTLVKHVGIRPTKIFNSKSVYPASYNSCSDQPEFSVTFAPHTLKSQIYGLCSARQSELGCHLVRNSECLYTRHARCRAQQSRTFLRHLNTRVIKFSILLQTTNDHRF